MFMVCDILGLCCIVNFTVCMSLMWLPYGVINYNNIIRGLSAGILSEYHVKVAYLPTSIKDWKLMEGSLIGEVCAGGSAVNAGLMD